MYSVCRTGGHASLTLPFNDLTLIYECLCNLVCGCNREPKLFFVLLFVNQVSIRVMYSETYYQPKPKVSLLKYSNRFLH